MAAGADGADGAAGALIELDLIRACLLDLFVIGFIIIINFRFK